MLVYRRYLDSDSGKTVRCMAMPADLVHWSCCGCDTQHMEAIQETPNVVTYHPCSCQKDLHIFRSTLQTGTARSWSSRELNLKQIEVKGLAAVWELGAKSLTSWQH